MSITFAAISLATLGALVFKNAETQTSDIVSTVNGKTYRVMNTGNVDNDHAAADMLATLENRARKFIHTASVSYPKDTNLKRIKKYWTGTITEIPQTETIAYAIEKKELYMCVRDSTGAVQQEDDLLFVLLHELSHIMNPSYGHDEAFWSQFKRTLEIANKMGYLPYKDYDTYSVTVCGKVITSNPMTCVNKGTCKSELGPIRPGQ
jgi:hypothetical protein